MNAGGKYAAIHYSLLTIHHHVSKKYFHIKRHRLGNGIAIWVISGHWFAVYFFSGI